MKLVDILARELEDWPGDFPSLTQSAVDEEIYGVEDCSYPVDSVELPGRPYLGRRHDEEDQYPLVTRAQWQAAVEALSYDAAQSEIRKAHLALVWNGNGLPPINTICEQHPKMGVDEKLWRQVKFIAHVTDFRGLPPVAVFMPLEGTPAVGQGIAESFRAFRAFKSEEEVAAEEREAGIRQLQIDHGVRARDGSRVLAERLWDMGYRKQVQP